MEMRRFLIGEDARQRVAVFRCPKSLESFSDNCRIFAMVVAVHLNVGRADVHLAAAVLR